ncbi:hypothetical protein CPB86DRAFT_789104 [Serendipita vermifera]|nr:hypothetical protein CPB86DRAFT_789104 [Serendipita vermifera]
MESAVTRTPPEVWQMIFYAAAVSPLFPYLDIQNDQSSPLGSSILDTLYLFGEPCHPLILYSHHQTTINSLRRVCRTWNDLILRQVMSHCRWMFTDGAKFHYPPPSLTQPQSPTRILIDFDDQSCYKNDCIIHKCVRKKIDAKYAHLRSFVPKFNALTLPEHDLSKVRIVVMRTTTLDLMRLLAKMPSLQALSLNFSMPRGLSSLYLAKEFTSSQNFIFSGLTHLQLFGLDQDSITGCSTFPIVMSNLLHLTLHFRNTNNATTTILPTWTFPQLHSLCISGRKASPSFTQKALPTLFTRCGSLSSMPELLLDLNIDWQGYKARDLITGLWNQIPNLALLGFRHYAFLTIISSILSSPPTKPIRILILTSSHSENYNVPALPLPTHALLSMKTAYESGHIKQIFIDKSPNGMVSRETFEPYTGNHRVVVTSLVQFCRQHHIPIYYNDGWEIYLPE